jgi:PPM family protein phosphatase
MIIVKNTERSCVQRAFDGLIHKRYRGHHARQRLENEVRVLEHLRIHNCPFVPRLIEVDRRNLTIVQTNCGASVQSLADWRLKQLFAALREFHVEHGDCELRNVTYRATDGIFCIVDFELAAILESSWSSQLQRLNSEIETALSEDL